MKSICKDLADEYAALDDMVKDFCLVVTHR